MAILHAFQEGGPFMYLILAFGVFTVTFIFERWNMLYRTHKAAPVGFRNSIVQAISRGDFHGASSIAEQSQTAIGRIVATGCKVRVQGGGEEEVQARMDEKLSQEIEKLDRRTGFLAMFGNVATLVGLLGTIGGMISSFAAVAQASPLDRATLLSKGISEAMNCTAFGLLVAVPALVCFAVFQNKTDRLVGEMTNLTTEIYHDLIFLFDGGKSKNLSTPESKIKYNTPDMSV